MGLQAYYPADKRKTVKPLAWGILAILLLGFLLVGTLPYQLTGEQWLAAVFSPDQTDYRQVIVHFSYLPRLAIALLCGGGLAIAGCMMQYVLRNPLASPTTLGVAAGAELGLACSLLLVPASLGIPDYWFAFAGGLAATGLVFVLTAHRGFAPLQMVLAGMVVSLFFGSLNMMILLVNEQQLTSMFIWGAGALDQTDWKGVQYLLPLLMIPCVLMLFLLRPLSILQLGEEAAASVGVRVASLRVVALVIAVFITSAVVSKVGIIGFVGLVAPALAKLLGARHLLSRLIASCVIGAVLLLTADLLAQPFSGVGGELLPTGAFTALVGAPFLLWLLHRQSFIASLRPDAEPTPEYRPRPFRSVLVILLAVTLTILLTALLLGNSPQGWLLSGSTSVLELRAPRVLVALLAGVGLALAGTVIQRVTGNGMASPEVMGISAGASLALVLGAMSGWVTARSEQMLLATMGAMAVMGLLWLSGRRNKFSPAQMLLTGVGLSACLDAVIRIAMSSGQDNVKALLTWLSGSTYLVAGSDVWLLLGGVASLGLLLLFLTRWLDTLTLGEVIASGIGLHCQRVRQWLMLVAAMLTALATIVIGPLSFVGLLAPHMARSLGQYNARHQLVIASLIGGNIMMVADWVGRNFWFPWQFPAGLLASVIGGGYFLYLLRK